MSDKASGADNQQERLHATLTPDYIVGIVDGEGYFSVSVTIDKSKNYLSRRVKMVFGIKLNSNDGRILYNIRDWFECGEVRYRSDIRENFCDCLEFQVRDMIDLRTRIIPFFKKYPLQFPRKQKDFEKFIQIAFMVNEKKHLSETGFVQVKELAELMHS